MAQSNHVLKFIPEVTPYLLSSVSHQAPKVWIVLPAFNEAENLGKLIEAILERVSLSQKKFEIVVVNDGSHDGTSDIARGFQFLAPITVIEHSTNLGLGATMRDGFEYVSQKAAPSDIVIAMDADNTHNPGLISRMVDCILEGNDVVIASRYQNGSHTKGVPGYRQLLSLGASYLFRVCFPVKGVRDYTCGYRAYRVGIIQAAFRSYGNEFINQNGFECMVDILIKLRRLDAIFSEVPLVLRYDLKVGVSKMKVVKTITRSLGLIVRHRLFPSVSV